jgi:hypothetical protein
MSVRFSHVHPLAVDGMISFGNEAEGEHSGFGVVKIPVNAAQAAAATSEYDTGFDLKAGWVVMDAWIVVKTVDATETVDVGTDSNDSGDANGFIAAASLATAGFVYPDAAVTAGTTETYFSANTRGALLADYIVGSNVDQDYGLFHKKPFKVAADIDVTFTTSSGTDTAVFDIYFLIFDPSPTDVFDTQSDATMAVAS